MPEFTSKAKNVGGRAGRVWSDTGSYDHQVVMPGAPAEGVTPEELIAGAWASCFGSAFEFMANKHGLDASGVEIRAAVTLNSDLENVQFDIVRGELKVALDGDNDLIDQVIAASHDVCPVSKLMQDGTDISVTRAS